MVEEKTLEFGGIILNIDIFEYSWSERKNIPEKFHEHFNSEQRQRLTVLTGQMGLVTINDLSEKKIELGCQRYMLRGGGRLRVVYMAELDDRLLYDKITPDGFPVSSYTYIVCLAGIPQIIYSLNTEDISIEKAQSGLPEGYNYEPLPSSVELKESEIHGMGVFAKEKLNYRDILGVSHIAFFWGGGDMYRTPLGGYINHSNDPNCSLIKVARPPLHGVDIYQIVTNQEIGRGAELTLDYNLEPCGKPSKSC